MAMTFEQFRDSFNDMSLDEVLAALRALSPKERAKAEAWIRKDMFTISPAIMRGGNPLPRPSDGQGYS